VLDVAAAERLRDRLDGPVRVDRARHREAAAAAGLSSFALARDQRRAAHGPGRLSKDEYFYYRFYDSGLPEHERARYVGKAVQARMHGACNDPRWFAPVHDKALFYTVMRGLGLPIPETVAVFEKSGRTFFCPALRREDDLRAFLTDRSVYPLFAKPIDGMYSIGSLDLLAVDGEQVRMKGGEVATVGDIVRFVVAFGRAGYLFQRRVRSHPLLADAFGDTLASIRLLMLLDHGGSTLESAVVKVPRPGNVADNYWRTGNMLGSIDPADGRVRRVVSGVGEDTTRHEIHPDTKARLIDLALPDWNTATTLCVAAANAFPGVRTQSWDVALTPSGPVLLEFNFGGDLNLHQLAHRRGALTDRYAAHLRRCGYGEL
jgi:hypothetical protein